MKKLLLVIVGVLFFVLQYLTPMLSDDLCTYVAIMEHSNPLSIVWKNYFSTVPCGAGNRFAMYATWYFIYYFPYIVFSFVNTIIFVYVLHEILFFAKVSCRVWILALTTSIFIMLRYETCLWNAGATSYLWSIAMSFVFLRFFLSHWGHERFRLQLLWFLPLGFVLAGWHELVSLSVSAVICIYWLERIWRKDFYIDGQFILSLGFGLGALAILLSPCVIARAGGGDYFIANHPFYYTIARKGMVIFRCTLANPLFLVSFIFLPIVFVKRNLRAKVSHGDVYLFLLFLMLVASTCLLADGLGRTNYFVTVISLVAGFRLLSLCFNFNSLAIKGLTIIIGSLTVTMVIVTYYATITINKQIEQHVSKWLDNPLHVAQLIETSKQSILTSIFHRAVTPASAYKWGYGESWTNGIFAKYHKKPYCIGIDNFLYENLYSKDLFCNEGHALNICGTTWFADDKQDILVFPITKVSQIPSHRTNIVVRYKVKPSALGVIDRLKKRIFREGWAEFSLQSPELEMRAEPALAWFYLPTFHNLGYIIVRHNHHIPRSNIRAIEIIESDK